MKNTQNLRILAGAGLLVAMNVILSRFFAFQIAGDTIRISLGNIPLYVAGIVFGPKIGGTVGAAADLLGYAINSFGYAFNFFIFLASVFRGLVPGLVFQLMGNNGRKPYFKVSAAIILAEIASGVFLTTYGLAWQQKLPFLTVLGPRLASIAVQIPVYIIITSLLVQTLRAFRASRQAEG